MNIVFLNPSSNLGGAERCLVDMMASLRHAEPSTQLHLIVPSDGPLVDEARRYGTNITLLPIPQEILRAGDSRLVEGKTVLRTLSSLMSAAGETFSGVQYLRRLRRVVRTLNPDVVHSNGIKCHLLSRLAGIDHRRTVWHIHDFLDARPLAGRLLRWSSSKAIRAIAVSDAVARVTQAILPRVPVTTVFNAIDTEHFKPSAADGARLDDLAGFTPVKEQAVRVGLVATYARWKGQDLFLEAAADVVRRKPRSPLRFYIIGGPIYDTQGSQFSIEELRQLARNLGIDQHVGFIGFQNDPADVYRGLDIVVHASTKPEPFGRTIVEAMACGRAVVVSQAGGAAELFTHERDAIGVAPNDVTALAQDLERLAGDASLRRRIGEHARQTATERFSRDRLGLQLLHLYNGRQFRAAALKAVRAA